MAIFKTKSQKFCMSFTKDELPVYAPIEEQLVKETGRSRSGVYKDALKFYANHRQISKLQLV